jgi:hypothetical protein
MLGVKDVEADGFDSRGGAMNEKMLEGFEATASFGILHSNTSQLGAGRLEKCTDIQLPTSHSTSTLT